MTAKLLRDLGAGGSQILPVQLAIGLDSVRRFRFLTPAEYAKNGGVRGLERLHIERHLHDSSGNEISHDEALNWRKLAAARWTARFHAVQFALSSPAIAPKALAKAELLAHAAVGLDPTGELSRQLLRESILPVLDRCDATSRVASWTIAVRLRHAALVATALARALVQRMESEQESDALSSLGKALAGLSRMLKAKDVQPGAAALVKRMGNERDSFALSLLQEVLAALSGKLEAKDVQPGAAALVKRVESELDNSTLSSLGQALAVLSGNLEAKDVQPGAAALEEAMRTRNDFEDVPSMAKAWVALEGIGYGNLDDRKRVQAYVDLLRLPLVVDDARKALLDGLDQITEKFAGDLWRFVDWATESDRGQDLRLDLGGP